MEKIIRISNKSLAKDSFSINPYTMLPLQYIGLGGSSFVKGDLETGREQFAAEALHGRQLIRVYRNRWEDLDRGYRHGAGTDSARGVYGAFLSGDPRLIEGITEDLRALDEQVDLADWDRVTWYLEVDLLSQLYRGDEDAAAERVNRLGREIDRDLTYNTMRHRIHEGLVDGDATAVENTLQKFADSYREIIEKPNEYWQLLMSHEAATYHLLARHLGLDISVASDEIPDGIESYELGDRIDLQRPDHVDEDLIPDA